MNALGEFLGPRSLYLATTVVILFVGGQAWAQATSSVDADDIIGAWKQRQTRVHSVAFVWEQPKGDTNRWQSYQAAWAPQRRSALAVPENSLKLSETSMRYETNRWFYKTFMEYSGLGASDVNGKGPSIADPFFRLSFHDSLFRDFAGALQAGFPVGGEQRRNPRRFTSDAKEHIRTEVFDRGDGKYAQARILNWQESADTVSDVIDRLYFLPILLAYRPLYPTFGYVRPENCRLHEGASYVDGCECVLLKEAKPTGMVCSYWIDPAREFVVVRYIAADQTGRARAQLDISYREDPTHGWTPSAWTALLFTATSLFPGQDLLPQDASAEVKSYAINSTISEKEFIPLSIQPGSIVSDEVTGKHSIALGNGHKRVVTEAEILNPDTNYENLLNPKISRRPNDTVTYLLSAWPIWCFAVLVFTAALVAQFRRRVCRRLSTSSTGHAIPDGDILKDATPFHHENPAASD